MNQPEPAPDPVPNPPDLPEPAPSPDPAPGSPAAPRRAEPRSEGNRLAFPATNGSPYDEGPRIRGPSSCSYG